MSKTIVSSSARAAVLLLALACGLAPACSARTAPCLTPSLTPAQQAHAAEVARLREIQRGADITKQVGELMVSLAKGEIALYEAGRIQRDTHTAIHASLELASEMVLESLDIAKDATKPIETRMTAIQSARKIMTGLKTKVIDRLPEGDVKLTLGLVFATAETLLLTWNVGSAIEGAQ